MTQFVVALLPLLLRVYLLSKQDPFVEDTHIEGRLLNANNLRSQELPLGRFLGQKICKQGFSGYLFFARVLLKAFLDILINLLLARVLALA